MMKNIFDQKQAQLFLNRINDASDSGQAENMPLSASIQAWKDLQLPQGSVVLLVFSNCKDLLQHVFAILFAGYVPALISPATPALRLNLLVKHFNAKALIKPKLFTENLEAVNQLTNIHQYPIAIFENNEKLLTFANEIILTTSGTSDFSSGCVFDISMLLCNANKHADAVGMSANDVILINLPLFYSYAFVAQALAAYVTGASLCISSPPFSCSRYLNDIDKYQVTHSSMTPLLVKELLSQNVSLPNSLRAFTIGGDTLDNKYTLQILKNFPRQEIYLTYGITEAGPRVSTLAAHLAKHEKLSSVGLPLPGTEVKLSSETGELLIHSDTILKRRLGPASKPLFEINETKSWLKTGDIFNIDADGYLFFQRRISDFVVMRGEKINLAAIKSFAAAQSDVISAKINLIKDNNDFIAYDLNILIQQNAADNLDKMKSVISKGLKVYERPRNIIITKFGESEIERYK